MGQHSDLGSADHTDKSSKAEATRGAIGELAPTRSHAIGGRVAALAGLAMFAIAPIALAVPYWPTPFTYGIN